MGNPFRGEGEFECDGETYRLVFDINAFVEAEDALGMDTQTIIAEFGEGTKLKVLRGLLWAGLRARHPDVHLIQAGEIISEVGVKPLFGPDGVARKALAAAFATAEENPPKASNRKAKGTTASIGLNG